MIKDIFEQLDLQISRINKTYSDISDNPNWKSEFNNDDNLIKTIDSFIFRYIKVQDIMGKRLFRYYLDALGEYEDSLSLLDMLDKLEKLGILEDSNQWMMYRKLRNLLTHEYPDNTDEIIHGIGMALDSYTRIKEIYHNIKSDCLKRNVI